jgi:hypothetical protein
VVDDASHARGPGRRFVLGLVGWLVDRQI